MSMRPGFEQILGIRRNNCSCHMCRGGDDPRLEPVVGDWVDELVNWQLEQGRGK